MASKAVSALRAVYGRDPLPRPFNLVEMAEVGAAEPSPDAQLSPHAKKTIAALRADPHALFTALGLPAGFEPEAKARQRVQGMLGQLLLGLLAERRFEQVYKSTLGTTELRLEDSRASRDDTDYRVLNGRGRPVFRINIKFHGSLFRNARDLVGLEPEDCFALATYKIKQGLEKQEREVLPYLFVVVSCPMSSADVGAAIPHELVDAACLVHASKKVARKRSIEERIVDCLVDDLQSFRPTVTRLADQIASSKWRVLSARRANVLLRDKLFERVYAVRLRGFAQHYRNAEVDMHFSLKDDMTPLDDFLQQLATIGLQGVAGRLERGLV